MEQAEIDERVKMFVDMEDPDLTVDLRELIQEGNLSLIHFGLNVKSTCKKTLD